MAVARPQYPILGYAATEAYGLCVGSKATFSADERKKLLALLRQVRAQAGLRQIDLAERIGQPQSFVSKYESGERRLDILELRQVCVALGISLEDFVRQLEETLS
jgi:ribosome-binding protein aMBF1 (putative translation factor)